MNLKNRPATRHYPLLQKIAKLAKGCVLTASYNHVIKNFDLKELACANKVTRYADT